jgi:hypothetical protein
MSSGESNKQPSEADNDLSDLLDNALGDFASQKKAGTTDDDLDDFMTSIDQEAAQKAAKNFQHMLEALAESGGKEELVGEAAATTASVGEPSSFMEAINR